MSGRQPGHPPQSQKQVTAQRRQNVALVSPNSDYGGLLLHFTNRIKHLQSENLRLSNQLNQQKTKDRMKHRDLQSGQPDAKLVDGLKKNLSDLQAGRMKMQRQTKLLQEDLKNQLETFKTQFESQHIKKTQQKFEAKEKIIKALQEEINQLRKDNSKYNKLQEDKNYVATLKNLYEQSESKNKQLSERYVKDQQEFARQLQANKQKFDQSMKEYNQANKQMKSELERLKSEQNKMVSQKMQSLQASQTAYLQILLKTSQLEKSIANPQLKKAVKAFTAQTSSLLKQTQAPEVQRLGSQFKTILEQIVSHIRSLQDQKNLLQQDKKKSGDQATKDMNALRKQRDEIVKRLNDKQNELRAAVAERQNWRSSLTNQTEEHRKSKAKITQLQNNINQLKKDQKIQLQQKDRQLKAKDSKIAEMQATLEKQQKSYTNLENSKQQAERDLSNQINKLTSQLEQTKLNVQKLRKDLDRSTQQHKDQLKASQQLKTKISQLEAQGSRLKRQLDDFKLKNNQLQKNLTQSQNQLKSRQEQLKKLNKQISDLKAKLQKLNADLSRTIKEKQELNRQTNDLFGKMGDLESDLRYLRPFEEYWNRINKELLTELAYYIAKEKISLNINEPNCIENALKQFKGLYNQARYFSCSQVLQKSQVNFVIEAISKYTKSTIEETKLVYRFDPKNNLNFHQYIDNKQNLVVLVKIYNNYVVGGYSHRAVKKMEKDKAKQEGLGRGILFNVTREQVFQMKRQPKMPVVSYDDFFYIFGNSEIRLKTQERKLFSNFAVAASTFDSMGVQKAEFLGEANSEVQIITYEFYQIKFRQL